MIVKIKIIYTFLNFTCQIYKFFKFHKFYNFNNLKNSKYKNIQFGFSFAGRTKEFLSENVKGGLSALKFNLVYIRGCDRDN